MSLTTDSRLMDGITLSDEYWLAHQALGLERADVDRLVLHAARNVFLPQAERAALVERISREIATVQ